VQYNALKVPTASSRVVGMPEISRFFGVVIRMYYRDHAPPHFHVQYGGDHAAIGVTTREVLFGKLSPRATNFVREWAEQHERELLEDWELARKHAPLKQIEPLR